MEINYKKLAQELLGQATKESGVALKDVPSSTPNAYLGHGAGGLFSYPGLGRELFSAMILPRVGLASVLPVKPSIDSNPLDAIITGVTDSVGEEPTGVCDDPPVSGVMKLCMQSFVFGRFSRMTKVYDVDKVGLRTNRGEFMDFQIYGNPFKNHDAFTIPGAPGSDPASAAKNEIAKAMFELATAWSRDFAQVTYTGTPTNNTAQGGYKEFYGLETLVNTGHVDAETGIACPAADSIVWDFASADISANSEAFVRNLTYMVRNLRYIAQHANLLPVQFVITMNWGAFYEATELWACTYASYRCIMASTDSTQFVDSGWVERLRDDMRGNMDTLEGQFLLIDGAKIPVIIDQGIPETENGDGTFTSDIYVLPFTVLGRVPVLFYEYIDYSAPGGAIEFAKAFTPNDSYFTTDGGRFMWHKKPPNNFCVQLLAKTEPRLKLLTPYLAGRLQNITYTPLMHERSPFSTSGYYVNGGSTSQPQPSFYPPVVSKQ